MFVQKSLLYRYTNDHVTKIQQQQYNYYIYNTYKHTCVQVLIKGIEPSH